MLVSELHAVLRVKEREAFGVRVGVAEADVGDGRSRRSGQLLLPHRIEDLLELVLLFQRSVQHGPTHRQQRRATIHGHVAGHDHR